MIESIKMNLLWRYGTSIGLGLLIFGIIGFFIWMPLFICSLLLFIFSLYFFRNPKRSCNANPRDIIAPADGIIIEITHDPTKTDGYEQKIAIFLSLFDAHVQWIPISGTITHREYIPGKFFKAYLPKASLENEHHDISITNQYGTFKVRQIAGILARRICWWVRDGQQVEHCQTYGMIRFGSRVELFLPKGVQLNIGLREKVYGGQTVIGSME